MTDFGGKLRQARERRGISLRQIAASTKISVAALEALERNDISKLPGGIFSRAFVRSYATEVGLNPDETVKEFLERFQDEPQASAAHAAPAAHHPAPAARETSPRRAVDEDEGAFESRQRIARVLLKLLLISLPLIGVILYLTVGRGPAAARHGGSDTSAGEPAAAPAQKPSPDAVGGEPAAQPTASQPPAVEAPAATGTAAAVPVDQPLVLEIHPTGACWVSLTVDGQLAFARLMQPGEKEVRPIRNAAVIEIGDAGAFAFTINGRPGRSLGAAGQVRTARISRATLADYLQR